jgi:hypothetical protein
MSLDIVFVAQCNKFRPVCNYECDPLAYAYLTAWLRDWSVFTGVIKKGLADERPLGAAESYMEPIIFLSRKECATLVSSLTRLNNVETWTRREDDIFRLSPMLGECTCSFHVLA